MRRYLTTGAAALLAATLAGSPATASLVIYDDGTGNDASIPEGGWTTTWQVRSQDENVHTGSNALHTRQDMASSPGQFPFNHAGLDVGANTTLEFYMNKEILSFYVGPIQEPTAQNVSVQIRFTNPTTEEEFQVTFTNASHVYLIDGVESGPGFAPDDDPTTWEHVLLDLTQPGTSAQFDPSVHLLTRVWIAPHGHSFSGSTPHLLLDDIRLIPEPASLSLLALGGMLLMGRRRQQRMCGV